MGLFLDLNTEFLELRNLCFVLVQDEFQCAKIQSILVLPHFRPVPSPPYFICSGDGTGCKLL